MQIIFSERELEDFLCKENNLKKYLDLEFVARQVSIPPAGIIDILAYHKESKSWVIIELKKDLLDLSALAQGMAYLRYYQELKKFNYVQRNRLRNFSLLLIGSNLDESLEKVVALYEKKGIFENSKIYYKLFGVDFASGISFDFFNPGELRYSDAFEEVRHELEIRAVNKFNVRF